MAYYLTIKKGKEYKKLDVTSLDKFERMSNLKNDGMSLEEVDKFTTKFKDEIAFKTYLCQNGILEVEDIIKDISIRRKNKNELVKVRYGLVYNDDAKYLDIYYVRDKILSMQSNREFINKLLDYYRNNRNAQSMIYVIRDIMLGRSNNVMSIYMALDEFVQRELFDENILTGESRLRYKSLHDLGMFLRNYENRFMLKTSPQTILEGVKNNLLEEKKEEAKVRKRVNKKDPIEGQYSFFDE